MLFLPKVKLFDRGFGEDIPGPSVLRDASKEKMGEIIELLDNNETATGDDNSSCTTTSLTTTTTTVTGTATPAARGAVMRATNLPEDLMSSALVFLRMRDLLEWRIVATSTTAM